MKLWRKFLWFGTLAGLSTALLLVLPASKGEGTSDKTIRIMGTSSINGETSPCG